jgi:hypothetical protein
MFRKENFYTHSNIGIELPELRMMPPDNKEVERLCNAYTENRNRLFRSISEYGLNTTLFEDKNIYVGPFVYPTPVATTYVGSPGNLRGAIAIGDSLSSQLKDMGFVPTSYASITLAISRIPNESNKDGIILPINTETNKEVKLFSASERGKAYGFARVSSEDILRISAEIKKAGQAFAERAKMKRVISKEQRIGIIDRALSDVALAWQQSSEGRGDIVPYLDFALKYNQILTSAAVPTPTLPSASIDTSLYSPFIKEGIADPETFVGKMIAIGVCIPGKNIFKIVKENGETAELTLGGITSGDVQLNYATTPEKNILLSELIKSGVDIAPCKELSYFLCFSSILPVIYGDINNEFYYYPYAVAREQIEGEGLSPVMYRIQPVTTKKVKEFPTLFDFYQEALLLRA